MRKYLQNVIFITIALSIILMLKSATASSVYSEDKENLRKANWSFKAGDFESSLDYFNRIENQALIQSAEHLIKIGVCYFNSPTEKNRAIPYLEKALVSNPKTIAEVYNYLGQAYQFHNKYGDAIAAYEKCLEAMKNNSDKKKKIEIVKNIAACYHARDFNDKPMNIKIHNMGSAVNSQFPDYGSVFSKDESKLYYNTLKPSDSPITKELFEIVCFADLSDSKEDRVKPLDAAPIPTTNHEAILGFSENGDKRFVYEDGDIYLSKTLKTGEWVMDRKLNSTINSIGDETSLALSFDGKTLYFASDRMGGYGGLDLYKSELKENGLWGPAVNLGPTINSDKDEDAPFISKDEKSLYFSSKGHLTMGGYDIFRITMENGQWTLPVNMGVPINSVSDDIYFNLNNQGVGYLSSDRKGGFGSLDIYKVVFEEINIPATEIRGLVYLSDSYFSLDGQITITDKLTSQVVASPAVLKGEYSCSVVPGRKYIIKIEAENFMTEVVEMFIPYQQSAYTLHLNLKFNCIKGPENNVKGQQLTMNYAFFDIDKFFDSRQSLATIYELESTYSSAEFPVKMFDLKNILNEDEVDKYSKISMVVGKEE